MPSIIRSDSFRLGVLKLTTTHLTFTVQAVTPLQLDEFSGASLRGNFFNAVWRRFCTNKSSPSCAACPIHDSCPVSTLVAPLREESARGQDIPRPYVIIPPQEGERYYQVGEQFSFGMTLIGYWSPIDKKDSEDPTSCSRRCSWRKRDWAVAWTRTWGSAGGSRSCGLNAIIPSRSSAR